MQDAKKNDGTKIPIIHFAMLLWTEDENNIDATKTEESRFGVGYSTNDKATSKLGDVNNFSRMDCLRKIWFSKISQPQNRFFPRKLSGPSYAQITIQKNLYR